MGVRDALVEALNERADELNAAAERRERIYVGVAIVTLAVAVGAHAGWSPGRSPGRCASLTRQAKDMADHRLPDAVTDILDTPLGENIAVPQVDPVRVRTRDEVADVAEALNTVQDTALDLAVEQAVLRRNIADSFVNLGRRNQNLLGRQLDFITELESNETDADTLSNLFRLDHLATRMRRNAESLLVLAGIEPPRQWAAPVRLTDVIRAALGEVEDYHRVAVRGVEPATIIGSAAADLAHLLAELIENALVFSPPDQSVDIRGPQTASDGGYTLAVIDTGLGMAAERLAAANRRLAGAESFTVAPSKYLGHYVAGNLAARHEIHVRLDTSPGQRHHRHHHAAPRPAHDRTGDQRPGHPTARPAGGPCPDGAARGPAAGARAGLVPVRHPGRPRPVGRSSPPARWRPQPRRPRGRCSRRCPRPPWRCPRPQAPRPPRPPTRRHGRLRPPTPRRGCRPRPAAPARRHRRALCGPGRRRTRSGPRIVGGPRPTASEVTGELPRTPGGLARRTPASQRPPGGRVDDQTLLQALRRYAPTGARAHRHRPAAPAPPSVERGASPLTPPDALARRVPGAQLPHAHVISLRGGSTAPAPRPALDPRPSPPAARARRPTCRRCCPASRPGSSAASRRPACAPNGRRSTPARTGGDPAPDRSSPPCSPSGLQHDEAGLGHLPHGVGGPFAGVAAVADAAVGLLVGPPGRHLVDEHAAEVEPAGGRRARLSRRAVKMPACRP